MDENQLLIAWDKAPNNAQNHAADVQFYVSEFFEQNGNWQTFSQASLITREEFKKLLIQAQSSANNCPQRQWREPDKNEFLGYFQHFQSDLAAQKLEKVVPVVFASSSGHFSKAEKLKSLIHLMSLSTDVYAYGFWQENSGFLGATPEVLIVRKGYDFKTMALAGTARKEGPNLLKVPKELSEHQLVINDISKKLANCQLQWQGTHEWPMMNLKHLRTFAKGTSDDPIEDLIKSLHPTSALGTSPSQSRNRLNEYCDPLLRKFFGSPFGVRVQGRELIVVALRNIQWFNNHTYLGSGCGLVAGSEFEKEWQELSLKREFTKDFLDL
ncbi:MAG: chorismate-binding protein [Bdellovibrionales bacterium]|nr:chorismate-binding protein [Bdellovibrionales bacterium]